MLTRDQLLRLMDAPAIEVAIARAGARTSGEICVSIAPWFWGNIQSTAELAFHRLGMDATRERNTVLIFVVPARRSFAVIGDTGIHARVGAQFWIEISERLGAAFRVGHYTEGLIAEIDALGERLARDFPVDLVFHPAELPSALVVFDRAP